MLSYSTGVLTTGWRGYPAGFFATSPKFRVTKWNKPSLDLMYGDIRPYAGMTEVGR